MTQELTSIIESAWDSRDQWNAETIAADQREAIMSVLAGLNNGSMRVAEKTAEGWLTHQWIKKAVLLSFRLMPNEVMKAGPFTWYDKLPVKFHDNDGQKISESGIRAIPGAIARYGSFIEPGAVLMPSIRGPPWAPALRSARTATSRAALASAAFSNPCRLAPRSLRTTASSAHAAKSSKVWSSKKTP